MKKIKEVSEKYLKDIYICVIKALLIIIYFFISNFLYRNVNNEHLETVIQIISMAFGLGAIYIFEIAYKKDDGGLALKGIEILIFSLYMMTSKYITDRYNLKNYSVMVTCIYAIYFALKAIVIYMKGIKELAGNLSDIRQIVKKDKPIKKEATKRLKNIVEK